MKKIFLLAILLFSVFLYVSAANEVPLFSEDWDQNIPSVTWDSNNLNNNVVWYGSNSGAKISIANSNLNIKAENAIINTEISRGKFGRGFYNFRGSLPQKYVFEAGVRVSEYFSGASDRTLLFSVTDSRYIMSFSIESDGISVINEGGTTVTKQTADIGTEYHIYKVEADNGNAAFYLDGSLLFNFSFSLAAADNQKFDNLKIVSKSGSSDSADVYIDYCKLYTETEDNFIFDDFQNLDHPSIYKPSTKNLEVVDLTNKYAGSLSAFRYGYNKQIDIVESYVIAKNDTGNIVYEIPANAIMTGFSITTRRDAFDGNEAGGLRIDITNTIADNFPLRVDTRVESQKAMLLSDANLSSSEGNLITFSYNPATSSEAFKNAISTAKFVRFVLDVNYNATNLSPALVRAVVYYKTIEIKSAIINGEDTALAGGSVSNVPVNMDEMEFMGNAEFDINTITSSNINFEAGSESVECEFRLSTDNKKLYIKPKVKLKHNLEYTLRITKDVKFKGGISSSENGLSFSVTTLTKDFICESFNINETAGKLTGSARVTNKSGADANVTLIIATYKDGACLALDYVSSAVLKNESKTITTPSVSKDDSTKTVIYVWDDINNQVSLSAPYIK